MSKKDVKVDELKHQSGLVVDIMFDPNSPRYGREGTGLTFSATIADKKFRFKSADEVKAAVIQYLKDNSKLTWFPVIEIAELAPFNCQNAQLFVGFDIDRYYLAEAKGGSGDKLRRLHWRDYEPDDENWMVKKDYEKSGINIGRINRSAECHTIKGKLPDCLPYRSEGRDSENFVVAYEEAVWVALQNIQEGISRLKDKLRSLTGTTQGLNQLETMGSVLLKMLPDKT